MKFYKFFSTKGDTLQNNVSQAVQQELDFIVAHQISTGDTPHMLSLQPHFNISVSSKEERVRIEINLSMVGDKDLINKLLARGYTSKPEPDWLNHQTHKSFKN